MIKKILFIAIVSISAFTCRAQSHCPSTQDQLIIKIVPDNYPTETTWSLYDDISGARLDSGQYNSDTICVDTSRCLRFTIYDSYGVGMCCAYGNGSYALLLNGVVVDTGGMFEYSDTKYINCPMGHDCTTPLAARREDTITAPTADSWYLFTPDSTGIYNILTCGMGNTCPTNIWVYDHCAGLVPTATQTGTILYNDTGCANHLSFISGALVAGQTYYIRIGQTSIACADHTTRWMIHFVGPITGCMDPLACNYNPLATVPDTASCIYPPSPLCALPDLAIDRPTLVSSLYYDSMLVSNDDCFVNEGCLSGFGERYLLCFTTHVRNIGNLDYYIGAPDSSSDQFVWDPCHQHWHYVGYAEYLLYDHLNNPVQVGFKNGFCVEDLECGGGGVGKYGCGDMGITAGCGDIYAVGLPCQWIDLTPVDTGIYTLVVGVNWNHKPDKLGHYERTYSNNWAQICVRIYYDSAGHRAYDTLADCPSYIDCVGDTFGPAQKDCMGVCNGSTVRGDLNADLVRDSTDLLLYLDGITAGTLAVTTCNDLNGDGQLTVTDPARLNGCIRYGDSSLTTLDNPQSSQHICVFPYNVYDQYDSVVMSIADVDWQAGYIDISAYSPLCEIMAYELQLSGATIDSVQNLAASGYRPDIRYAAGGHIVELSDEDQALIRQLAPFNFLRV